MSSLESPPPDALVPAVGTHAATLTDSPWFWLYLFSIAALAGLFLIAPKYYARQSQVERQYQGKVRASQAASGADPSKEMSSPEATRTSLTPLIILFGAIWICAWPLVWWTLRKRAAATPSGVNGRQL